MQRRGIDLVGGFTVFAQVARVTFNRLALVVADTFRVRLYKTTIEHTARQAFVVVGFDGFEIMDGNSCLIADVAQADTALLAGESQLFAYTRCHLQSLDSWRRVVGLFSPGLSARRLYECVQLPLFLHYSLR